ncbi:radical SAM protein [Taibaiella soli]|uniref:Coproporphyrinogen III oxidase n=1 Tax=Taibaiella soli TaxID=1649169 RepID=A0A2W2BVD4_9BACT|nr:radical SAM protein [Taibaiella soli]PZF71763.1 coproporphyrinogen III oxidase [Taibaiella soli]
MNIQYNIESLLDENPHLNLDVNQYNINVTANYGEIIGSEATITRYKQFKGDGLPAHLYFHIPLCTYVCHFCNYVKKKASNKEEELDNWMNLLLRESSYYLNNFSWIKNALIQSLYFGGGTASILGVKRLKAILDHVKENYKIDKHCEITLEGNPDNFLGNEVVEAKLAGFNRFSLGVQSFQSEVNSFAGRGHDKEMSLAAIKKIKEAKSVFNVDMMFGLPYQTCQTVENDIKLLTDLEVPTITIYRLRNADREKMEIGNKAAWNVSKVKEKMINEGLFPSLRETYRMRDAAVNVLITNGYVPSPCGWWNAPHTYAEGNIPQVSKNKWENYDTMIAYGPGAYGWLSGLSADVVQTHNEKDINVYQIKMENIEDAPPLASGRVLSGTQAVATALGFAFKANQKIKLSRFKTIYGVDLITDEPYKGAILEMIDKDFLEYNFFEGTIKPTYKGEAMHEEIISIYIHDKMGKFNFDLCKKI